MNRVLVYKLNEFLQAINDCVFKHGKLWIVFEYKHVFLQFPQSFNKIKLRRISRKKSNSISSKHANSLTIIHFDSERYLIQW